MLSLTAVETVVFESLRGVCGGRGHGIRGYGVPDELLSFDLRCPD
jgi:hypothetical protein